MSNITGFITKLLPYFSKSDILSDLEVSLESISIILDQYTKVEETLNVTPFKSNRNKKLIDNFYKELSAANNKLGVNKKNIATDTLTLFKNVKVNGDFVHKSLSDKVNTTIISNAIDAYSANLLRAVPHYSFMTHFSLDLLNYFFCNEVEDMGQAVDKNFKLNKKQVENIESNLWIYARLLATYGDKLDAFKHKLSDIQSITLPKDEIENISSMYDSNKLDIFNNLPNNFIGSPIYSIRLVFATWSANRYRKLKDQKKLLELRYLHLKMLEQNGEIDINLEKEIESLNKRITDIDYKLSKVEESVE